MASTSNTLGGLLDLERELAYLYSELGRVIVVEASGTTYGSMRARDKVKDVTGLTQAQVGTALLSVNPKIKAKTG
jgi:hypothetical protein